MHSMSKEFVEVSSVHAPGYSSCEVMICGRPRLPRTEARGSAALDRIFDFLRETIRRLFDSQAPSPARFASRAVRPPRGRHDRPRHESLLRGRLYPCMREIWFLRPLDKCQRIRFVDIAAKGFAVPSIRGAHGPHSCIHGRRRTAHLSKGLRFSAALCRMCASRRWSY